MIPEMEKIEKGVSEFEERMDRVMQQSRAIIRMAGKSITAMHVGKMKEAEELLGRLDGSVEELMRIERGLEHYSLQAYQEYAEARIFYYIIKHKKIQPIKEMKIGERAYLLGLMDVVGELKREAFEELRKGEVAKANAYYNIMLDIYDSTLQLRFAGNVLPDFRRKQDVARIQIESTIGELVRRGA